MDINQIRQQYPQYEQLSDGELAYRLWDKSYKGKVPMGQFADRIKLPQEGFSQMLDVAKSSGYEPTSEAGDQKPVGASTGVPRSVLQGMTFGLGDEIVGGISGAIQAGRNVLQGQPANLRQEMGRFTGQERGRIGQFREESPVISTGSEIGGAVASGVAAPAIGAVSRLPSMLRAGFTGGAAGAAYGAGSAEGGVKERAKNAVAVGIPSALFGGAMQGAVNVASPRLAVLFKKSAERPSIEILRSTKNAAYQAVDDSGLKFAPQQMNGLLASARSVADDVNYVPDVDRNTFAAIRMIENNANKERTIGQLDKMRQGLWKRYNASKGSEPAIMDMIDAVDDMIASHPATDDLMTLARQANSRFKKAELLDMAMDKAQLQTAGSGSGGNILNKYKQAVTSILTNPNKSKWFNGAEIGQMRQLVEGSISENALRNLGKLSHTGNGLMLALNVGAVVANPAMAGVTAAGAGAKYLADKSGERAMQGLMNTISGAPVRAPVRPQYIPGLPQAGASATGQNQR